MPRTLPRHGMWAARSLESAGARRTASGASKNPMEGNGTHLKSGMAVLEGSDEPLPGSLGSKDPVLARLIGRYGPCQDLGPKRWMRRSAIDRDVRKGEGSRDSGRQEERIAIAAQHTASIMERTTYSPENGEHPPFSRQKQREKRVKTHLWRSTTLLLAHVITNSIFLTIQHARSMDLESSNSNKQVKKKKKKKTPAERTAPRAHFASVDASMDRPGPTCDGKPASSRNQQEAPEGS
jgi:hypothetical protein